MTVKELIEALQKMPQDVQVITEGCDCYEYASGIIYVDKNGDGRLLRDFYYNNGVVIIERI